MFLFLMKDLSPYEITPYNTPYNILSVYWGWVRIYGVILCLGIGLSILSCYFCLKIKKVPTDSLVSSVFFVVPSALIGASFFGKYDIYINNSLSWYDSVHVIFLSLFNFKIGGMSIHGGVLFGLIAGIIFFNFSSKRTRFSRWVYFDCIVPNILLGQSVGRWGNFFNHELLGKNVSYESLKWLPCFIRDNCWRWCGDMPEMCGGFIVWRSPIFLYESFWNFVLWVFLIFVIPVFEKMFCLFKNKKEYLKISIRKNNCYPTQKELDDMYLELSNNIRLNNFKYKIRNWWHGESYKLTKLNDSKKFLVFRIGVKGGLYFSGWNLIRFILETQRVDDELFIMNNRTLDYLVLWIIIIFGLLLIVFVQWFAPYKIRKNGFVYEREYFDYKELNNWKLKDYLYNNLIIGEDNYKKNLEISLKKYVMKYLGYDEELFDEYFILSFLRYNDSGVNGCDFSDEIECFSFKICVNNNQKKFYGFIKIDISIRLDLSQFIRNRTIFLKKLDKYASFSKVNISNLLSIIINNSLIREKIINKWKEKFRNISFNSSGIMKIDTRNLINSKELTIPSNNSYRIIIERCNINDIKFYFFSKKIILWVNLS